MRIGVDLDEVLAEFVDAIIAYHNAIYKTQLTKDNFKSYNFWETWGGTKEQAIQKVISFQESNFFNQIQPVEGSQQGITELGKEHSLYIITSRSNEIKKKTVEWVSSYFSRSFSGIYLTNQYAAHGKSTTKREMCDKLGIDLMIEDSSDYALECQTKERKVLILDQPWNQRDFTGYNIVRAHTWNDILQKISERGY